MGYPTFGQEDLGGLDSGRVGIFIGPEGGWSQQELADIKQKTEENKKFKLAGLGKTTLRAETAAVVASWMVAQG